MTFSIIMVTKDPEDSFFCALNSILRQQFLGKIQIVVQANSDCNDVIGEITRNFVFPRNVSFEVVVARDLVSIMQ